MSEAPQRYQLVVIGDDMMLTYPLTPKPSFVLGSASDCDIKLADDSVSPRHAELRQEQGVEIVDLDSHEGTWVGSERIKPGMAYALLPNQPVRLGDVTLVLQVMRVAPRKVIVHPHDYLLRRLTEECARAARKQTQFAVAHLEVDGPDPGLGETIAKFLRETDVVAEHGPGRFELLLLDSDLTQTNTVVTRLHTAARSKQTTIRVALAWFPADGQDPEALLEGARSGIVTATAGAPSPRIIVSDERMAKLHEMVGRVAQSDISVLLLGETGVGKEIFAEEIHRRSARAKHPFVRLNCSAFTETLLESELFGFERGAFTGANAAKQGLLEAADGGTVFLDEVGELPLSTQAKLLRVLEERVVLRIGSLKPKSIDVRFLSATNRDLEAEVESGKFRLDLLYRLNAVSISIPPLRQRRAEIAELVALFASRTANRMRRDTPRFDESAMARLTGYSWPGNVRELRNVIERTLVLATGSVVSALDIDIPEGDRVPRPTRSTAERLARPSLAPVFAPAEPPSEKAKIEQALAECAGNQTAAAKRLGVSRRTLVNKLERYGIVRPRKSPTREL